MYGQIDDILLRSKNEGITKLLSICTTLNSFKKIKELVKIDPIIYGTFGIHPHETSNDIIDKELIIKTVKNEKIIGVGETGLDFYYNHSDKKVQTKSFISHIEFQV